MAWIALAAALSGAISYLADGQASPAAAHEGPPVALSGPSSEAWNLPKHI